MYYKKVLQIVLTLSSMFNLDVLPFENDQQLLYVVKIGLEVLELIIKNITAWFERKKLEKKKKERKENRKKSK